MRRLGQLVLVLLLLIIIGGIGFFAYAWKPGIDPLPANQQSAQVADAGLIAHGAELASVGYCTSCHTAPGGKELAGGLAVQTPFGTIYSTNITPDPQSGIGAWSEAAFQRAMREGVDREGNHLYPAFPFDHFTHVTDEDNKALYAYLMSRQPVAGDTPANELGFPFNIRMLMAGWKLLFLKQGPLPDDTAQSAEWNRGRYLVEGLAHCAACHTPRNALGAEDGGKAFSGTNIEGWYAYPINVSSPAPVAWTADSLANYLGKGFDVHHGAARGPMAEVTSSLKNVSQDDLHAMATYIVSQMQGAAGAAQPPAGAVIAETAPPQTSDSMTIPAVAKSDDIGSAVFSGACSACHDSGREPPFGGIDLTLSTAVHSDSPQNIVNMVLFGLPASEGQPAGVMPGFAGAIDEDHLVALIDYVRKDFGGGKPAWSNTRQLVKDTLSGKTQPLIYSSDGVRRPPAPLGTSTGATQ
ncbi:MAG TPA: cytochrome c [Devosiaceae bacterium]|jgi:mono/diheme cytochrome c family protein